MRRLKILHAGDFRKHGYLGKGLFPTLEKLVGQVDILITEGTMLGRRQKTVVKEGDIQKKVANALKDHKYVFALCSSTDRPSCHFPQSKQGNWKDICRR